MVGGAALFGVGALCYYGLGLSNEVGAIDRAMVWPQVVRDRVRSTYTYFAGSLALTAGTAYAISQSRAIYTLMRASPWLVSLRLLTIRFMYSVVVRIQWTFNSSLKLIFRLHSICNANEADRTSGNYL